MSHLSVPDPLRDRASDGVTAEGEAYPSGPKRLKYVETPAPQPGTAVPLAPGVSWGRIPLPIDLNHINVWLLDTGDGCVLVDTGMAAQIAKDAWETLDEEVLVRKPPRAVFVTHIHPDHIGLSSWLQQRFEIPVLMSRRTHEQAQLLLGGKAASANDEAELYFRTNGVTDLSTVRGMFSPSRFARLASGLPEVARHVADEEVLQWGENGWVALETNGHAEGHLCLFNAQHKLLVSGDQVLPTISSNISFTWRGSDPNPLQSFLSSLRRLRELPADTLVLPSHGLPFRGLRQRVDDLLQHHEEQLDKLANACTTQKTASDILPIMFRRELKGMHLYLALGEALAHLEYLVHAGRVERRTDAEGVIRYVRV